MKTIELKADEKAVESFIKEIQALFPKHKVNINNVNDFSLMHEERKNCLKCNGLSSCLNVNNGHCLSYENDEFVLRECKYKTQERIKKNSLIKTLYLPQAILNAKLEDYDTDSDSRRKVYQHIVDYNNQSTGLYLYGTFSKGKTYSLAVIANELAKKDVSCLLIYFPDLVIEIKSAIGTKRFDELINMLKDIDVLMLDDIGSENMTPWLRDEVLGPVINYRLMEHKALYITSNINPKDLKKHLSIDDNPQSALKADRIITRMQGLLSSISLDDGKSYNR